MSLRSLSALLATVSIACSSPTEIVVVIDAEPALDIEELTIHAAGGSPETVVVDLATAAPWTLALRSARAGATADVTVTATLSEGTITQQGRMRFVDGERLLLYFYLSSDCAELECENATCFAGECLQVDRDACPFREPLPRGPVGVCSEGSIDAGADAAPEGGVDAGPDAGGDGGPIDAGPDAGPPVLDACDPTEGVCDVAVGGEHACAIDAGGNVFCWGGNSAGQIGRRIPIPNSSPALVAGISAAVDVAAGINFTCALSTDARVRCFGENNLGQLGRTAGGASHAPVLVEFPAGVVPVAITAGSHFACALTRGSEVYCWGANGVGQLGAVGASTHVPQRVASAPASAVGVVAGSQHACAWGAGGDAVCWGQGVHGQLAVAPFQNVIGVAAGRTHTCVLDDVGAVRCVGGAAPVMQAGGGMPIASGATAIVSGSDSTCALTLGLRVCWGANLGNHLAVLAGSAAVYEGIPPSEALEDTLYRSLAMGSELSCGIDADGQLFCWGYDLAGGVGQGAALRVDGHEVEMRHETLGSQSFVELTAGGEFTCGRSGTEVFCWGEGFWGQHGDGLRTIANAGPNITNVGNLEALAVDQIIAGPRHACARAGSELSCWGHNSSRAIFDSSVGLFPQPGASRTVGGPAGAGESTTCWVDGDGVACVGRTDLGQGGVEGNSGMPRTISPVAEVRLGSLAVGDRHACVTANAPGSGVHCWGDNSTLQLGRSDVSFSADSAFVEGTGTLGQLAAGTGFTCGSDANRIHCWGDNSRGQLGRAGLPIASSANVEPIDYAGDPLTAVAAGGQSVCAYGPTTLVCWGDNQFGQLSGIGGDELPPTVIAAPAELSPGSTIASVTLGPRHRCVSYAETAEPRERTFCYGSDEHGRGGSGRRLVFEASRVTLP